eukprot:TRINITY_DN24757_c0_g1_i1.p1 TRINITY_DN24757_c0_g1~~TRINITY_DN24757_c0_g1_i1.p1  ORF type:complete len:113 (-),score=30.56 TRINITY_DN24757_c0_g1_i1:176-514(-)
MYISLRLRVYLYFWYFFFFQAEDGIRDLVRSRGLGDVYKRQSLHRTALAMFFRAWWKGHGMSQTMAASALGLTSRTVQNYEAGEQEIPRTVMLAMRGFDASPDLRDGVAALT